MLHFTRKIRARTVLTGAGLLALVFVSTCFLPLDRELLSPSRVTSLRILDVHGALLREVLSEGNGRGRWCSLAEISPHVIKSVIASEDARFYHHPGVDPVAIGRAVVQNLRAMRVVSGASTISMQVVRNLFQSKRTFVEKLRESWYALRLERMMSKDDVLVQYLNRVPFGNQTYGIDAAARLYFAKPASQLSLAESAFLAAIPNSPTTNDPYKRTNKVRERQLYVLSRMVREGFISEEEREQAMHEPLVLVPRDRQFKAPHFTTMILQKLPPEQQSSLNEIHTTLDENVQRTIELLLNGHLARLKKHNVTNGAAVVIDNRLHRLVAMVGSKDFGDTTSGGQVNGTLAPRQPGSTLKPFTYGIALEQGGTAADLLADIPREGAKDLIDFLPENYDKKYHGPVRMRTALACSYNIPAVRAAENFGEEVLLQRLHLAGFASLRQPSEFYGVGLTLGNGEVTLLELCNAYSALANGGVWHSLRFVDSVKGNVLFDRTSLGLDDSSRNERRRVFSEQIAFILTDILSDAQARAPAFGVNSSLSLPFPCAAKTGTSKDYRDNWTVGYTPLYTVAVWVGNFNGMPMKMVSGITGAAPLFRDIMLALHPNQYSETAFAVPDGIVQSSICPRSGMPVAADCPGRIFEYFIAGTEPRQHCVMHKRFRMDRRSSMLATRMTPPEFIEEKVFELFPHMFAQWAEQEGIEKPPTEISKGVAHHEQPLAISSPSSGDVFMIDPILRPEYQTITVESAVSPGIEHVALYVNGGEVAVLHPPYRFRLPLASLSKGNHRLLLKGRRGSRLVESDVVDVAVR